MDDAAEWTIIFTDAGVDSVSAKVYAKKFAQEKLTMSNLEMLGRSMLTELGVSVMGDALSTLKLSKVAESKSTSARASVQLSSAKAPQLYRAGAAYHVSGEDVPLTSDEDSVAMLSLIAHITFN